MKLGDFFVARHFEPNAADLQTGKLEPDQTRKILQYSLWRFEEQRSWNRDAISNALSALSTSMGIKLKDFMLPLFVAVSGRQSAPSIMDAMAIIGSDMTRARLRHALDLLGGPSEKEIKEWEKEYRGFNQPGAPENG